MPAFIIADVRIENPEDYPAYMKQARAIAESYGGRYRARGGELEVIDKDLWEPTRMVIIEFPDMAAAKAFAHSAEYAPVAKIRQANAKSTVVIIDGID